MTELNDSPYVREICGQYMIVAEGKENIDFSDIISLNETAAYLWRQIEHDDRSEKELAKMLIKQYSLDENTPLNLPTGYRRREKATQPMA